MKTITDLISSAKTNYKNAKDFWLHRAAIRDFYEKLAELMRIGSKVERAMFGLWVLKFLAGELKSSKEPTVINYTYSEVHGRKHFF
ncbi:MAG: hypothetical protein ABH837_03695 [bacterium]